MSQIWLGCGISLFKVRISRQEGSKCFWVCFYSCSGRTHKVNRTPQKPDSPSPWMSLRSQNLGCRSVRSAALPFVREWIQLLTDCGERFPSLPNANLAHSESQIGSRRWNAIQCNVRARWVGNVCSCQIGGFCATCCSCRDTRDESSRVQMRFGYKNHFSYSFFCCFF